MSSIEGAKTSSSEHYARGLQTWRWAYPRKLQWLMTSGSSWTRQWNLDLSRTAGWMAKTIIQMCDRRMKESWLVERALMELVANQAVLNEHPDNALRFSMEEHNSNVRISQVMDTYSIGSSDERAAKSRELEEAAELLRSHDLDLDSLKLADFKPFGLTVRQRFEAAGLVPHYEVLYLVASDYAHMNGRAVHHLLERDFERTAASGSLAITIEFLIRSLRMTNDKTTAGLEAHIDSIQAEYVAAQPSEASRRGLG